MKSIAIFTFFFLFQHLSSQVYQIDPCPRLQYEAEKEIMRDNYGGAIQKYNEAFRYGKISNSSIQLYLELIDRDSILTNQYFDSLLFYLAQYNQPIEKYSYSKLVQAAIQNKTTRKYPLKNVQKNFICSEFEGKIERMAYEDKNVRELAMKIVSQVEMYNIEPHKSNIWNTDSLNYLKLCELLREKKYEGCYNAIFEKHSMMNHLLKHGIDSSLLYLDKIMLELCHKGLLDKAKTITNLNQHYNQSKHHPYKSAYNVDNSILFVNQKLIYSLLDSNELEVLNNRRAQFNMEPYDHTIAKYIWQIENGYDKKIILTPVNVFNMSPSEEADFISNSTKVLGKKIVILELNKRFPSEKYR
ncbi:MAG: hypothetical protein JNL75_05140 [Chitinophagales bacterium]|nr:hypothetical protein [Chitinophagales bacterium]